MMVMRMVMVMVPAPVPAPVLVPVPAPVLVPAPVQAPARRRPRREQPPWSGRTGRYPRWKKSACFQRREAAGAELVGVPPPLPQPAQPDAARPGPRFRLPTLCPVLRLLFVLDNDAELHRTAAHGVGVTYQPECVGVSAHSCMFAVCP